jgi:hypothetical protein
MVLPSVMVVGILLCFIHKKFLNNRVVMNSGEPAALFKKPFASIYVDMQLVYLVSLNSSKLAGYCKCF